MAVSGVNTNSNVQYANADQTKLSGDFDQFLTLLTTQLQNQDPLSPMDSAQFTQQLVAFSGVEQQIKSNTLLSNLLSSQTLNMTALGVSFIGKNVEVAGKTFDRAESGNTTLTYEMPQTAKTGTITIVNEAGETVWSKNAELESGVHSFTWDGKNTSGITVPPGKYTIKVGALTEDSTALKVTTYVPGYVNSLETADDGSLVLDVNGTLVPLSDVRKISAANI